jgi:hypothetical protein
MALPIDENAALEITAVRAIESTQRAREIWTDDDRVWAGRVAAEMVGEGAAPESFLAARARFALERIGQRVAAIRSSVAALQWRAWVGAAIAFAAFIAGIAIDEVGGSQRINLLAPPLIGLLVWNLAVYAALGLGFVLRYGEAASPGPLRALVTRVATGRVKPGRGDLAAAIARFASDWSQLSTPLYAARAARILHFAAAAFAAGLIAGLYVRGIALEYRASWESTFLDATSVRALLRAMLAPGVAISGAPFPSIAEVAAIRAPASENAARWLHWIALTVVPLVLAASMLERHRSGNVPIRLDEPYFVRLLRGFRGGPARVQVAPYSYAMPPGAASGLERMIRNVFGSNASLTIMAPIAYGDEDDIAAGVNLEGAATLIALFNATATPEPAAHGVFLDRLRGRAQPTGTLVALVDESAFRERWRNERERLEERRASWRALCADRGVRCTFAALGAADIADAQAELERAIDEASQ